jgi:hypothetical protein
VFAEKTAVTKMTAVNNPASPGISDIAALITNPESVLYFFASSSLSDALGEPSQDSTGRFGSSHLTFKLIKKPAMK